MEDVNGEHILHYEQFVLKASEAEDEHTVTFTVPITEPKPPQYFLRVVSDKWLNAETLLPVSFRRLILPEKSPPNTELLDLQPLPVSALRYKDAAEIFYPHLTTFNPIQTQTFSCLYSGNENSLVCAPAAAGKEVCIELCMIRAVEKGEFPRIVYLAPVERMRQERFEQWGPKFEKLGQTVACLTGEVCLGEGTGWLIRIGPVSPMSYVSVSCRICGQSKCPPCRLSDLRSHVGCTMSQSALHEPLSQCVYSYQDRNSGLVVPKVVPTIPTDSGLR